VASRFVEQAMMSVDGQHTLEVQIDLPMRDILRMLTGSEQRAVPPRTLAMVNRLIGQAADHLTVRAVYRILPVRRVTDTELELDGQVVFHGPVADFLKAAARVVVFVATIGEALDELAHEKRTQGYMDESFTFHVIGSAAAEASGDAVVDYLWEHEARPAEALTPAFCPGFCGMEIGEQRTIFSVLDASPIGVRLLPTLLMQPLKSVSGLIGIGQADAIERHGFPCERCPNNHCAMRPGRHHKSQS